MVLFPFAVTPRLVAIAASGAIHATVFASLAFTTLETGRRAAKTLETREDVPDLLLVAPPIEPISNEALEADHRPTRLSAAHDHDPRPRAMPRLAPHTEPHEATPDFLARFMMAATDEDGLPTTSDSESEGAPAAPTPETTYGEDDVSTPAKLLSHVNATYPMEAWSSGVEADVPVEIVVDTRGSVVSARVVTRAGHGFDDAALASLKSYRFAAAERDGHAVRVRVRWSIQFRRGR